MAGDDFKDYTNLSKRLCTSQMSEARKIKTLVKYLIQENSDQEKSWENELMPALCEHYATLHQYYDLLSDVLFKSPPNKERAEYLMVDIVQVETLRAHVSLIQVNEYNLF